MIRSIDILVLNYELSIILLHSPLYHCIIVLRSYSFIVMCAIVVNVNGLWLQEGAYLLI